MAFGLVIPQDLICKTAFAFRKLDTTDEFGEGCVQAHKTHKHQN